MERGRRWERKWETFQRKWHGPSRQREEMSMCKELRKGRRREMEQEGRGYSMPGFIQAQKDSPQEA